ncbi:hypothetical protein [Prosthecomicrobium sp. N25]|uniref:hypothetical protein n=1 Tax=Prosthecomicrobium sp. N25 TaxID=3129254 RepID=UPI0030777043
MVESNGPARRPLAAGEAIRWWQVGATAEERYDGPDVPMSGGMDPFFFATRHKNFIPHEYPCRTRFAAERRDKRPVPRGAFEPRRLWLPFGSPRLDLSGFWFRPTVLGTWARAVIEATTAGRARFRLSTCGGAILFVGGVEVGWLAPYRRNLETAAVMEADLPAGSCEILVWFDDLAERDARYFIELDYLDGPAASIRLGTEAPAAVADAVEAALTSLRFERPSYDGGPAALVVDRPLPVDAAVDIAVAGDFISHDKTTFQHTLKTGETRLVVADADDLPADFRHFAVTLSAGAMTASRGLGIGIAHGRRQGPAPAALQDRVSEALAHVARHGEPDSVTALARLALGEAGPETEAMLAAGLPAIEDCHDCADFILVPLLWCRQRFGERLSQDLVARIDAVTLSYRYWMDEPGNDVQWYFSENHALLFHTAAYLAGHRLPEAVFRRSGRRGAEQSAVGAARVRAWFDHFETWEMAEFNSAPYFPIDLKGLAALYALAPDRDIAERAGRAILRLLEIVAASAHHGILTAAQGRSYEHSLIPANALELSAVARLLWGTGSYGRRFHCLPLLALALRDHGLAVPDALAPIASLPPGTAQEWTFVQGQDRFAKLYHHKTADHALGTTVGYRPGEWGYQETVLHLRIGRHPDAQVWINQPGELIQGGFGRPSYWGGNATIPRVHQYRDLALVLFEGHDGQPPLSHAWFPTFAFDEWQVEGPLALARADRGLLLLKGGADLVRIVEGPGAGTELQQPGLGTAWIVRVGATDRHGTVRDFRLSFENLRFTRGAKDDLIVDDPDYGPVRFGADGVIEAEGRRLDPGDWTVTGVRRTLPDGPLRSG